MFPMAIPNLFVLFFSGSWTATPRWPQVDFEHNPLASSVLEQRAERRARTAWALVPNVGALEGEFRGEQ